MKKRATFREITVERLVLREPNDGRVRAMLETCGADQVPAIRRSFFPDFGHRLSS